MRISDWSSDVCSSDLDVFLALLHRGDEALAGEAGLEVGLVQRRRLQRFRVAGAAVAQPVAELVQPPPCACHRLRLARIGMHDQVQPALEVVEHRDFLAEHQQDVGRAQLVAGVAVGRSEEHTSELQSLMRISSAVFRLKKKKKKK